MEKIGNFKINSIFVNCVKKSIFVNIFVKNIICNVDIFTIINSYCFPVEPIPPRDISRNFSTK
jgi:hypothetical protein